MSHERPPSRIPLLLRWPLGAALVSWRYLWLTTPIRRIDIPCDPADTGPPLPDGVDDERVQRPDDGAGPLYHRLYRVRVRGPRTTPERLVDDLARDPNRASLVEVAIFQKVRGRPGEMRPGDEYVVRMPGPWDGPVRVVARTARSFRFATLRGHLEAGQVEFRARWSPDARPGAGRGLVFEIESWARSGDPLADLLYDRLWVAREMQLHLWLHVCERVAASTGGRRAGGIEVRTGRTRWTGRGTPGYARPPRGTLAHPDARRALDQLHDKGLNFDAANRDRLTPEHGWRVDDYRQELPPEPPGPPLPDGSWEIARRLMRDYEFADPSIIRAVYHPDRPLTDRDMLLEGRFLGLRFYFGCRVGGVNDETRTAGGRQARVWGWNYRTLQGHLEMGQMDYEVWKWLDTGTVEFRVHTVSRRARIANPLVRLGFVLFGRHMQVRFTRNALARMRTLTAGELARRSHRVPAEPLPRAAGDIAVAPAPEVSRRSASGSRTGRAAGRR